MLMEYRVVNFFIPGRIVSIREVEGQHVAEVDFGALVAIVLDPYQDEQVDDHIVLTHEGMFRKVFHDGAARRLAKRKELSGQ